MTNRSHWIVTAVVLGLLAFLVGVWVGDILTGRAPFLAGAVGFFLGAAMGGLATCMGVALCRMMKEE